MSAGTVPESIGESPDLELIESPAFALDTNPAVKTVLNMQISSMGQRLVMGATAPYTIGPPYNTGVFLNLIPTAPSIFIVSSQPVGPFANVSWAYANSNWLATPPNGTPILFTSLYAISTDFETGLTTLGDIGAIDTLTVKGFAIYPNLTVASGYLWDGLDGHGAAIGLIPSQEYGVISIHTDLGGGMLSAPISIVQTNPFQEGILFNNGDAAVVNSNLSFTYWNIGFPPGAGPYEVDQGGGPLFTWAIPPFAYAAPLPPFYNYASPNKVVVFWLYGTPGVVPNAPFNVGSVPLLVIK